jgi:hypothetical protein
MQSQQVLGCSLAADAADAALASTPAPHLRSQQAQLHIQDGTCSRLSTSSVTISQRNQSIRHTLSSNRMGMVQHPAVPIIIIISSSSWWYKAMMFHGTATAGHSKGAMMAAASVRQVDTQQVSEGS